MIRLQNAIYRSAFKVAVILACVFPPRPATAVSTTAPAAADTQPAATQTATTQPAVALVDAPLPHDPADVRGQFDNGLHYLIRKNADPPGKVYLNLAVRTGSLNESDRQNGLAHFLEHMAFKGSTHYAPSKLIPMLQHLGMRFGADTNAHTNQYETVFKLTMPDIKPETVELALTIFSDYANGLSLFPVQIESERRVILEEMRSRTNVASREHNGLYKLLFPGTQMAVHNIIGDAEILKTAQRPEFLEYWNQWYRPEKMTLIVVGDVDPDAIIAQAKSILGSFAARTPAKEPVSAGLTPFAAPRVIVMTDPEQVSAEVEMLNLQPVRPTATATLAFRHILIENLAKSIINRRLSDLIAGGNCPMQSAAIGSGDVLHDGYMVSALARGEP